jgi:hypothetical protein
MLCYLAGRDVTLDPDDAGAALRRAQLLLASGGDPRRALVLEGRAVTALAVDVGTAERRSQLGGALGALARSVPPGPAADTLVLLLDDPRLAWQCYAAGLLADDLTEDAAP